MAAKKITAGAMAALLTAGILLSAGCVRRGTDDQTAPSSAAASGSTAGDLPSVAGNYGESATEGPPIAQVGKDWEYDEPPESGTSTEGTRAADSSTGLGASSSSTEEPGRDTSSDADRVDIYTSRPQGFVF